MDKNIISLKYITLKPILNKERLIIICIKIINICKNNIKKYNFIEDKLYKNFKETFKKNKNKIKTIKWGPISFNRKKSNSTP